MRGRTTPHPTGESPGRWIGDDQSVHPPVEDYERVLGPPPSVPRLVGSIGVMLIRYTVAPVAVAFADGLLRLAGTDEICPCPADGHDASLEDRLHIAWSQGYYERDNEIREGRL